jgi:predicted transcriptional regulator
MDKTQEAISKISPRRRAANLTIYKLAKLAGVKWETLRNLERGDRRAQRKTLAKLDQVLRQYEPGRASAPDDGGVV